MKKVTVEVWSDFVCPWCWIAKRRFEKAVAALEGQIEVSLNYKAYRLAKGMAPIDFKSVLYQKFGSSTMADKMMAAVGEKGRSEGLVYNFDTMRVGDTSVAHAAIKGIRSPKLVQRMMERLYKAATTDGLDIFDKGVLNSLAQDVGATEAPFQFESPLIASEIAIDEAKANRIANGLPLFLFNDKVYLTGAREVGAYKNALLEAASDVPESIDVSERESCGIDGCAL